MHSDPESIASEAFVDRHIGPSEEEIAAMLAELGLSSLDELVERTVPESIRAGAPLDLPPALGEAQQLARLRAIAAKNEVFRSYIGAGYYDCVTPAVIQRNILENPGWYTQYTPYQAEIAQGRLEALLNFQTLVADLTGLPFSNASLIDESTAAAEAMTMCHHASRKLKRRFFVADDCHPQVRAVVRTRAEPAGIEIVEAPVDQLDLADPELFGVLVAYPATDGRIRDYRSLAERARQADVRLVMTTDLLALTLLAPPGEIGADIAVGSSQRFGVPLGYGGPHAAFIATRDAYKRLIPGRIVGVSLDSHGQVAYRLALQTREQHIRRDRATSNICTAQVLLAVIASMYAVYHGPRGLLRIARRVRALTAALARGLGHLGFELPSGPHFDTLTVPVAEPERRRIIERARASSINLREDLAGRLGVSLDETTRLEDVRELLTVFAAARPSAPTPAAEHTSAEELPAPFVRSSAFLEHPVFNSYHAEHELLRYMRRLESRDLSLTTSMIPLGSCTMKLNGTAEMLPITWPEFSRLHPFAPREQALGYAEVFADLERWLAEITGMSAVSLQPNAGAQGEYAGLLAIRAYHRERGEAHRNVCLIPTSAHGTNPATAVMAGMRVISVACDAAGNVDVVDLQAKADAHGGELGALMLTYPSTHGVFEEQVREICAIVHARGGLVYLDGANMNAQVGLCRPGDYGADVCHLNLHKTFCIPHGGGGPGMGPIAVNARLAPFLPGHPALGEGSRRNGPVSAAPYGSANILLISWAYIAMMGATGLRKATQVAILNANYMAKRLEPHYPVLFRGSRGAVAHEFIIDLSAHKKLAGVEVDDVAKRLMDCGYHAPTMSFPVPGTLMIEPTESESKAELDRFCDALIVIREELAEIAQGKLDRHDNPLKNAPHTAASLLGAEWRHPYSRERAAYPTDWTREHKYWPPVGRIDNARGDRQLVSKLQSDLEAALRLPLSERG